MYQCRTEQYRNREKAGWEKMKDEGNMKIVTKPPQKIGGGENKERQDGNANSPIGVIRGQRETGRNEKEKDQEDGNILPG